MFVFGNSIKTRTPFYELKGFNDSVAVEVGGCVAMTDDALDGRMFGNQFLAQREDCILLGRSPGVFYLRAVGVGLVKAACIANADGVCIVVDRMATSHTNRARKPQMWNNLTLTKSLHPQFRPLKDHISSDSLLQRLRFSSRKHRQL